MPSKRRYRDISPQKLHSHKLTHERATDRKSGPRKGFTNSQRSPPPPPPSSRPLRETMPGLPAACPVRHRTEGAHRPSRRTPQPTRREQAPLEPESGHLPQPATPRRTNHRLDHQRKSQTRPIPRNQTQPAMAHHQNSRHQPAATHQPRTHPHNHPMGAQPHIDNPNQQTTDPDQPTTPENRPQPAATPKTRPTPTTTTATRHGSPRTTHTTKPLIAQHPPRR